MIAYVYKPKRRKGGKLVIQRTYRGRFRLAGQFDIQDVPLDTTDKQAAHSKLLALVQNKEREKAGLTLPPQERDALAKTTLAHLDDFLADLKTLGRSAHYQKIMKARMVKLVSECGFTRLNDFTSDAFTTWRSQQEDLAPKTLNEYLNFANAFLNWLKRQSRLVVNPLEHVTKIDLRGRQTKRRAITPDELQRLLAVTTPQRRLIYLTAVYTGLRIGELRQLLGADLHLDGPRPYFLARAGTTKNKKEAVIPLHPLLAEEIRQLQTAKAQPVFKIGKHFERSVKRDLRRAKIEQVDALGHKLDFHAMRKTFATRLAQNGTSQRLTQELMRHSDPALTANIYTDASQLPTFDAVAALKWEGSITPETHTDTQPASQKPVPPCLEMTEPGTESGAENGGETLANISQSHALSQPVTKSQMVGAVRFELTTSCTPSKRAYQATLRPDRKSARKTNGSDMVGICRLNSTSFSSSSESRRARPASKAIGSIEPLVRFVECRDRDVDDSKRAHRAMAAAGLDIDDGHRLHRHTNAIKFHFAFPLQHHVNFRHPLVVMDLGILPDLDQMHAGDGVLFPGEGATGRAAWTGLRRNLIELGDEVVRHGVAAALPGAWPRRMACAGRAKPTLSVPAPKSGQ